MIAEMTGRKSGLIYQPLPEDDPKQRRPDISKAKRVARLGAVVPLEEGCGLTIEYFPPDCLSEGKRGPRKKRRFPAARRFPPKRSY
jgi:UDP-glucuronate decarboxylase